MAYHEGELFVEEEPQYRYVDMSGFMEDLEEDFETICREAKKRFIRVLAGETEYLWECCDTVSTLLDEKKRGQRAKLRRNRFHVDLTRLKESRYMVQNFALFVNLGQQEDPWERVLELYGYYREELEKNKDIMAPVYRFSDIGENDAAGRLSALLTVEEGAVCKGEPEKLRLPVHLFQIGRAHV